VDVLGPQEVARRKPYMQKAIAGEAVAFTLDYPGEQGTTYLALNCIPFKPDGVLNGFVGIRQDITSQRRVQVSASIGVAESTQGDGGVRELLHRADGMLYRAKAAGRGRQASAEPVPSPELA
jgi:GGDEF domain-containing protein